MNVTIEQLFTEARSQNGYRSVPVTDDTLRRLYELVKWGPTSANCSPARFLFVRTPEARGKLIQCVSPGNAEKVRQGPVTVVIGMDMLFYEQLPRLFLHTDARAWFVNDPAKAEETAFRNSSLQGGYFILAARALGLDCGPMSGFDASLVDDTMWPGTQVRTNFLCTLGQGDPDKLFSRSPRLAFDDACRLL
jgi:3-hydroxypropanoate dehydrogenase